MLNTKRANGGHLGTFSRQLDDYRLGRVKVTYRTAWSLFNALERLEITQIAVSIKVLIFSHEIEDFKLFLRS